VTTSCPFHKDKRASLSINLHRGTFSCEACNLSGGLIVFERKLNPDKGNAECWAAIHATIGRDAQAVIEPQHFEPSEIFQESNPETAPAIDTTQTAPATAKATTGAFATKLTERDLQMFQRIGISNDLLEAARVERVSNTDARERYGIKGSASKNMAGIVFPYYSHITGYRVTARVRRDNPEIEDGRPRNKYVSAYGDSRHLFFPPGTKEKLERQEMPIVLVEAEKSALALTAWGVRVGMELLAVGLGGCWSWRGRFGKAVSENGERVDVRGHLSDLSVCDGRTIYVCLDANAETNSKVQEARAALVRELRKRDCKVLICILPSTDGVNGPDDLIALTGDDAMGKVFAAATPRIDAGQDECWPEPERLRNDLPPVPTFDPELLPSSLRPMVEDIANRMQVPIDLPAVSAVATLAGVCGRRALIQPKQHDPWTVVPNLWGAIVGGPGMKKSPVIENTTAPAKALESEWREQHADDMREYEGAQERAKLDAAVWQESYKPARKSNGDIPEKPRAELAQPSQRRLIATDATFEMLHQLLAENRAGLFVLRDELSGWLASLERQGRESERAFYLECWNGNSGFTVDRIGRGSIHVEHCCVSLFGSIQPGRLRAYLADALRDGPSNDGLIQRFQLMVWPDMKPDWEYTDSVANAGAMKGAEQAYRRIASLDEEKPELLKFDPPAQALFVEWVTSLENQVRSLDVSSIMQAHLAKYQKLMPALALLFSLADVGLEPIALQYAQKAADWCDYLAHHAKRVYASRIAPERAAAITLSLRLMKGWNKEAGRFTIRDVYQNDWAGLGTPDEARAAVRVLEEAAWVRLEPSRGETGRPSEIYAINPRIGGARVGD
jgi:hypothetical protein